MSSSVGLPLQCPAVAFLESFMMLESQAALEQETAFTEEERV